MAYGRVTIPSTIDMDSLKNSSGILAAIAWLMFKSACDSDCVECCKCFGLM